MEKLSENEEQIWKVLSQSSDGKTVKQLQKITSKSKTTVYNALKGLRSKHLVGHEKRVWFIIGKPLEVKPSKLGKWEYKKWKEEQIDREILEARVQVNVERDIGNALKKVYYADPTGFRVKHERFWRKELGLEPEHG